MGESHGGVLKRLTNMLSLFVTALSSRQSRFLETRLSTGLLTVERARLSVLRESLRPITAL